MRARLTYGRGPRLIAAAFLALLIVATVLAIARPGARGNSQGSQSTVGAEFAGIPQKGTVLGEPQAPATLVEFADLQCPFCAQYARDALPRAAPRLGEKRPAATRPAARLADRPGLGAGRPGWPAPRLFRIGSGSSPSCSS